MPSSMNCLYLRLPRVFTPYQSRPFSSIRIVQTSVLQPRSSPFHSTGDLRSRKRKERNDYFSSSAPRFVQQDTKPEKAPAKAAEHSQNNKRKTTRSPAAKNSLRRVAVEAQLSKDGTGSRKTPAAAHQAPPKVGHCLGVLDS